jgi:hypothetical protein
VRALPAAARRWVIAHAGSSFRAARSSAALVQLSMS